MLARFLRQPHQRCGGDLAVGHRRLDRRVHRQGGHVQAEGRFVAVHRLQVIDHDVLRAGRRRHRLAIAHIVQHIAGKAAAQLGFEGGALAGLDHAMVIEGLDEGIALQQRPGKAAELFAADGAHAVEQVVGQRDHFHHVVQAAPDGAGALVGALLEIELHLVVFQRADRDKQQQRDR